MLRDLQYALRVFRKSPVFTAIAVLSLALGIGANTAIFSLIDAVLLKSLPVREPSQLVALGVAGGRTAGMVMQSGAGAPFSYPVFRDLRDRNTVFNGVLSHYTVDLSISLNGQTELGSGELVSGTYFPVLGVPPAAGRLIGPQDDLTPGAHPVAVLSYGYWQRRFAAEPAIIGGTIRVNDFPYTVIGVSAPAFFGVEVGLTPDIRLPMAMAGQVLPGIEKRFNDPSMGWVQVMARLKPGVSAARAEAATAARVHQLREAEIAAAGNLSTGLQKRLLEERVVLIPAAKGTSHLRQVFSRPLAVLMTVVALVLLIACANLANLLLARAAGRRREIAIRLAVGAGRGRLVRQLLTESLLIAALGAVAGIAFASFAGQSLIALLPQYGNPVSLDFTLDARLLAFTLAITVFTALLFGLAPALQATRNDFRRDRFPLRRVLVVAQVALSVVLLVGAGLFIRTFRNLESVETGYQRDSVVLLSLDPSINGYSNQRSKIFYRDLLQRVAALPGTRSVTVARIRALSGSAMEMQLQAEGYTGDRATAHVNDVGPRYFSTLGIKLLAGREFTAADDENSLKVAVVNQAFANRYFPNGDSLGRHISFGGPSFQIAGIAGDAKYEDVREKPVPTIYLPYLQVARNLGELTVYSRTSESPALHVAAIRRVVQSMDANLPIYDINTFAGQVDRSLASERLVAVLSTCFGAVALLLACIGIYGVMAFAVAMRTREIGIRMALGAQRGNVLWMVLAETLALVAAGIALGIPAALAVTRLVATQLYGVTPQDPATLATAAALLAIAAALAGYLPARRATKVDPTIALRYE